MINQNTTNDSILRISISEASRLFGVSTTTIRQAIKNQEIRYVVVRGRYKLNFQSVLEWSQNSTRRRNQRDQQGLGAFVDQWKINNKLYSPNPKVVEKE
ncbi:MAG: excisionase family DNA-binding protein [Patescibacteria group bacterium]|jgi:excisionase family DNA binding protein|nr:excisionase family DNA-binding protein [Patescibacteria group bacterium]